MEPTDCNYGPLLGSHSNKQTVKCTHFVAQIGNQNIHCVFHDIKELLKNYFSCVMVLWLGFFTLFCFERVLIIQKCIRKYFRIKDVLPGGEGGNELVEVEGWAQAARQASSQAGSRLPLSAAEMRY